MVKSMLLKGSLTDLYSILYSYKINPFAVKDAHDNTLVQICASNNLLEKIQFLLKYIDAYWKEQDVKSWINHKNKEDMTAVHIAVLSGNFEIVDFLINQGAGFEDPIAKGLSVMHLAAKSNNILLLAYFKDLGMSIVQTDHKGGTPLHWAAFLGCELSVLSLVSWGVSLNCRDMSGLTPLHLAAINGSTQIVRTLLINGADPYVSDLKGRTPVDFARDYGFEKVLKIFKEPGLLVFCGIKAPNRRIDVKCYLFVLFIVMLALNGAQKVILLEVSDYFFFTSFAVQAVFTLAISLKDPGYIKKNQNSLRKLCEENEAVLVCPQCIARRDHRSIHCLICNVCVEKFDHHCPWINKCIGGKNLGLFYLFLISTEVLLVYSIYFDFVLVLHCFYSLSFQGFSLASAFVFMSFEIVFFLLVSVLLFVQSGNLATGKTTNERFSNTAVESSEATEGEASSCIMNFVKMCCNLHKSVPKMEKKRYSELDFNEVITQYSKELNK